MFPLKLGVGQEWQWQWWSLILMLYFPSVIGLSDTENFIKYSDSRNVRNRNRAVIFQSDSPQSRPGPHLIAGAVPLPLPGFSEHSGIAQNFVRIDSNQRRFNESFANILNLGQAGGGSSTINGKQRFKPHLLIDMGLGRDKNSSVKYIRISNTGQLDEVVKITVLDSNGNSMRIIPSQFPLGVGATAEIPFAMPTIQERNLAQVQVQQFGRSSPESSTRTGNVVIPSKDSGSSSSDMITVLARGKRDSVQRSFVFGDPYDGVNYNVEPFCLDRDVKGTCRYRDDPVDCFRWEWTAYATIINNFGPDFKISSLPEGLFLSPGEHGRVRVYLKFSCCTPVVQFILTDIHAHTAIKSCVVDVRELQSLHPGEIAGIVVGAVFLIVIIIVVIIICARRRRTETLNKEGGGMIPRLRGRTSRRSKHDMEVITTRQ